MKEINKIYYLGKQKKSKHYIIKKININVIKTHSEAKKEGLVFYYTGKECKRGHLSVRYVSTGCLICSRLKNFKNSKLTYEKRINTEEKREKERERKRLSYLKNREKNLKRRKEYREKNKESEFIRRSLERTLSVVKFGTTDYFSIVGYNREDLKNHLSSLFLEGMSWSNYGEWHIDHIKPIKVFLEEGIFDPKIVNALSNLQPLWKKDNFKKGSKYKED